MPILYMSEELIKNKEGRIIDTKYTDVNKHFENRFFKRNEIIGKSGSEMFPESMPQLHEYSLTGKTLHHFLLLLQRNRYIL